MTSTTAPMPNVACILSEANGDRSRDQGTLITGQNLKASAVLGKITASGKYSAYDDADSPAGVGLASAILLYATDATAADKPAAVLARDAEVVAALLSFKTGTTLAQANTAKTDLAAAGIIVRGDWTQTFPIP
jgi:hypothetical protein